MEKNRKKYRVILGLFMIILDVERLFRRRRESTGQETGKEDNNSQQNILEESENLAEGYRTVYEKAKETDSLNAEGTIREIIAYLGESGYSAVDRENQINMVNAEKAESFCKEAQAGEKLRKVPFLL